MDGKTIVVTGGTGSFGNACVSYILNNYKPAKLIVYSRDEYKQFVMAERFGQNPLLRFFVGDVRDEDRMTFAIRGADYVFHAAAMKQIVTAEYNPTECIKTNIEGAENLIRASIRTGVRKVMAVSTDKAVKPINLYGASKACMEKLFVAANHLSGANGTRFACARYGNVIGSRGSVIPVFLQQRQSGTITITDERMTRFWLRIEDGVRFVAHCAEIMHGGEIFVSRMPSMTITDLAEAIAPGCKRKIIGIRPAEKLHEDLISQEDATYTYRYKNYFVVQPAIKLWEEGLDLSYDGEIGVKVPPDFSYSSGNNDTWLTVRDLQDLVSSTAVVSA